MNPPPIQIISCFFTKVDIAAQFHANDDDVDRVDLEVTTEPSLFSENPDPRSWFIAVTVKIKAKEGASPGYLGQVEAVGSFKVIDSWDETQIERLVYVNGSGLLYSSIREMISMITARGFYTTLTIPSWSFSEMFKELEESRKQEAAKAAPPSLPDKASSPKVT